MFVCPECGFRDLPCWRAHRYFLYVVYSRLDELEAFDKELANKLRETPDLEVGPYTYHLTQPRDPNATRYVLRVPTDLKQFLFNRKLIERYKPKDSLEQRKMDQFLIKELRK